MTVAVNSCRIEYVASAGQTTFAYPFKLFGASDLLVFKSAVGANPVQLSTSQYSVTGIGADAGGNVMLSSACAGGELIVLLCRLPMTQNSDYLQSDPFPAVVHETDHDRLVKLCQQLSEELGRALKFPIGAGYKHASLGVPQPLAYLRWSLDGTTIEPVTAAQPTAWDLMTYQSSRAGAVVRTIAAKLDDAISAADFGFSPGNSAAGNTTAWNTMMSAIAAGEIQIPPGDYHHLGLDMADKRGITIRGSGSGVGALGGTRLICDALTRHAMQLLRCHECTLSGFWTGHNALANAGMYALMLSGTTYMRLEDLASWPPSGAGSRGGVLITADAATGETVFTWLQRCIFVQHQGSGVFLGGTASNRRVGETIFTDCFFGSNGLTLNTAGLSISDHTYGVYVRSATEFASDQRCIDATPAAAGNVLDIFIGPGVVMDDPEFEAIRFRNVTHLEVKDSWIASGDSVNDTFLIDEITGTSIQTYIKDNTVNIARGDFCRIRGNHASIRDNEITFNVNSPVAIHFMTTSITCTFAGNKFIGPFDLSPVAMTNQGFQNVIGPNYHYTEPWPKFGSGLAVGDGNFFLSGPPAANPQLVFDANDFLLFTRSTDTFSANIAGATLLALNNNLTANDTCLLVWDITGASLKRVSRGAADSGGTGFRVLRIPN